MALLSFGGADAELHRKAVRGMEEGHIDLAHDWCGARRPPHCLPLRIVVRFGVRGTVPVLVRAWITYWSATSRITAERTRPGRLGV